MDLRVYPSMSPSAAILLAHGAGAGQMSSFMVRVARGFASRAIAAATFDFPYMRSGRRVPDPAAVLEDAWRDAIDTARTRFGGLKLVIGGKSMGGRIASQVAAGGVNPPIAGLVFLGYPLHPPGKPQQRRDAHLPRIAERMLFVQGTRDAFGTAEEIRQMLPSLRDASLFEVAGGDHSFNVPASHGVDRQAILDRILDRVVSWIGGADQPM
jgi:predicted alpha/beta-hydrolase family hydrolase